MRPFPRAARRRAIAGGLVAVATIALAAPGADAEDHRHQLEQKQKHVHAQQKQAAHDLDESSAALRKASAALRTASARLTRARSHLDEVNGKLAVARRADARLRRELAEKREQLREARSALSEGKKDVEDQRDELRDHALDTFSQGDPALQQLSALMGAGSLEDLTRQQAYGDAVTGTQDNTLQRLQAAQAVLTVREQDVSDATDAVAAKEDEAAEKVAEVKSLRHDAILARNQVLVLFDDRKKAARAAARVRAHDRAVLARLQKREEAIRKQILKLAAKAANRHVSNLGGMFATPVLNTYITSPYGWREHPIYHYWGLHNGDDLHAPCGTPERAIDTGKVIATYYSSVWGNRLYLSLGRINGHSYVAVYNHISAYKAHVGQVVGRGDTVAYAGTTGWSTACHLHFTILRDGNPVDPARLIGF
ncbi:peptidoglycan DD-metalloendopeptidase family protein [Nocardioides cheoyonin]|uniref:peptidoglycan DD-metalloendopeptidase family protein n=1 Tax=Nocardioides cheoyonin TaxID=3156615 RepID=UPI0032B4C64E